MIEKDFDWPPRADDELSIHDIQTETRPTPHGPSRDAIPGRDEEWPTPAREPGGQAPRLAAALTAAAIVATAAGWMLYGGVRTAPAEAGYQTNAPPPVAAPSPDADAGSTPPRITIRATYPVDPPPAAVAPPEASPIETPAATLPEVVAPAPSPEAPLPAAAVPAVPEAVAAAGGATIGAVASVPVPSPVAASAPSALIGGVLRRYEAAYDRRDVAAAASLWPSIDRRALARAFASLERQDVDFERCQIDASESHGSAVCVGTVRYVPSVGNGVEKQGRITWTFDLIRSPEGWQIAGLRAR